MILGPDLKAVTGSSTHVDEKATQVKELINKLKSFPYDVYDEKNAN